MNYQNPLFSYIVFGLNLFIISPTVAQDNMDKEAIHLPLAVPKQVAEPGIPHEKDSIIFGHGEIIDRGQRILMDPKKGITVKQYLENKKQEKEKQVKPEEKETDTQ